MSDLSELDVVLAPELAELVRQAVASGAYASSSDVIQEALLEWELRHALDHRDPADLTLQWEEGLKSGSGSLGSMDAIKREARNRLNAARRELD